MIEKMRHAINKIHSEFIKYEEEKRTEQLDMIIIYSTIITIAAAKMADQQCGKTETTSPIVFKNSKERH